MAGCLRRSIRTALAVIVTAASYRAYAQTQYHLSAGASVGASDNPSSQSSNSQQRGAADALVSAMGHFDLSHVGRRVQGRVDYSILTASWLQGGSASTVTQTLRLASTIQGGPDTSIGFAGGGTLARLSMVDTVAPADPQSVGLRPAGDQYFLGLTALETLGTQLGASWRLDQSLEGALFRPLGDSLSRENRTLTLDARVNRVWARDSAGVRARLGAVSSRASGVAQPEESPLPDFTAVLAEASVTWQHEWSPELTHSLSAGTFVLHTTDSQILPAGSASVLWHRLGYEVGLEAARTAGSNIYLGVVTNRSLVGLRLAMPLGRLEQIRVLATANAEHDSTADTADSPGSNANVIALQLALNWQPGDTFTFGLVYGFRDQRASGDNAAASPFVTLQRQTVMLWVGMQYPSGRGP